MTHDFVHDALSRLANANITVPSDYVRAARTQVDGSDKRSFPLSLLQYFARDVWLQIFRESPELRFRLESILMLVHRQFALSNLKLRDQRTVCLTARRYMLFLTISNEFADIELCQRWAQEEQMLPPPFGVPGSDLRPRNLSTVSDFCRCLTALLRGYPLRGYLRGTMRSREGDEPLFESEFEDGGIRNGRFAKFATTQWSCLDPLRPVVMEILRTVEKGTLSKKEAPFFALALICIYFGYDYRDALMLHVGDPEPGARICHGSIFPENGAFVRRLGTGFFDGDWRFVPSACRLPIPNALLALLKSLGIVADGRRFPATRTSTTAWPRPNEIRSHGQ